LTTANSGAMAWPYRPLVSWLLNTTAGTLTASTPSAPTATCPMVVGGPSSPRYEPPSRPSSQPITPRVPRSTRTP
jgi:hypothetical protein